MSDPAIIAPHGDLDVARVDEFRALIDDHVDQTTSEVIIDLSDVAFIDSSGLAVILAARERMRRERRDFTVVAPRGTAAAVLLTLAGLRRTLNVAESLTAALRR